MTLRSTLRGLLRSPLHSATLALSLLLGLGAAAAMHAVLYSVLLAPLPYAGAERLVSLDLQLKSGRWANPPALFEVYAQAHSLSAVGFYRSGGANLRVEGAQAEHVSMTRITASLIPLLGVEPLLGRTFTAEEELQGGPGAVILSEAEWRSRYGGAEDVLGRTLVINEVPRQVVGVMPAAFAFPDPYTRLWLPARPASGGVVGDFSYSGVARLAPGVSREQALAELTGVVRRLAQDYPSLQSGAATQVWLDEQHPTPGIAGLQGALTAAVAPTLWALAAAALLVLLAAWANVANLMLIRADQHAAELAVRATLGARRWRIAGHFLGEAMLLGGVAGAGALLLAHLAIIALLALGPTEVPRIAELRLAPATLVFMLLLVALSVLIMALVPALRATRLPLMAGLREGGRGESTGQGRQRVRALISAAQIAIALTVVLGSVVLLRSAQRLQAVHPGFVGSDVLTLRTLLPFASHDDASTVAFFTQLTQRVAQLPGVQSVGLGLRVPLSPDNRLTQRFRAPADGQERVLPVQVIDAGYFATLQIRVLAGREFASLDQQSGAELILSQQAATMLLGSTDPASAVGQSLTLAGPGPRYTVIGVVADVRDQDLATPPVATVYRPQVVPADPAHEPGVQRSMALLVRTGAPGMALPAIRKLIQALDPTVPLHQIQTLDEVLRASTARLSLLLTLMSVAAFITLVLGMIGLYGVMASVVTLRTREFGIRLALGAHPGRVAGWVAARGLALTAAGMAAGLGLYALTAPLLRGFVYEISMLDPSTLMAAGALLGAAAALACWLPARRAAQVDPAAALRAC